MPYSQLKQGPSHLQNQHPSKHFLRDFTLDALDLLGVEVGTAKPLLIRKHPSRKLARATHSLLAI
jgi:hypothetical protein